MHNSFIPKRFDRVNPGSLGIPVLGYTVRVVDDSGKDLHPGEIGYLAVIGPTGTRYWKNWTNRLNPLGMGGTTLGTWFTWMKRATFGTSVEATTS